MAEAAPEDWIGRTRSVADPMDPFAANALIATLELERPRLRAGDPLPPFWHWLHFHEAARASALGPDGHPAPGGFMPAVAEPRRMWAGGRLTMHRPLPLGAPARRRSTIARVARKTGRSGPLTFVTVETVIEGADGPCLTEEQDIVYRTDPPPGVPRPAPEPAPGGAAQRRDWAFGPVALFRYSALTFNGHRIHYDADYAREVEGYPGLVVHGPLLATLLLELATEIAGAPRRFDFRARAPVFAGETFAACAEEGGGRLWVAGADGRLAMTAEAGW